MAHALILGASGISGWSLLNQARTYPTPTTFARITGTTNRPLTLEQARLPADDPRLALVSGIDFTKSVDEVAAALRDQVPDVETVSHVFYTAYIDVDVSKGQAVATAANTELLAVAVKAVEKVSPRLAFVVLQTGGKGYGLMYPDKVTLRTPLREDAPRIPRPWADEVFYYAQHDLLRDLSRGKNWTFSEIRPDVIVGFAPTSNAMNMARGIGIYLSVWRRVFGTTTTGAGGLGSGNRVEVEVPFPGSLRSYRATHTDTNQDVLSKMEIFAAVVNPEGCGGGRAFNVADGGAVISWSVVWPRLCERFGLIGVAPPPPPPSSEAAIDAEAGTGTASGSTAPPPSMKDFIAEHVDAWVALAREHGLDEGAARGYNWDFLHVMLVKCDFDREYDLTRAREVGFREGVDTVEGYFTAWERMRSAKQLPSF
ncbi:uncharacterized protein CCOS01_07008 [Colletotrichum costaricense]|uniref:PRISE-like Rossmann-fold domain-containing protein n=1 Tax=Colletotrichum costaricense TaxID=1209916 RepID=A0AAI9YZI8_9PEZI|nr:uncharacterized protein CCOS01_07008 [Colletotrichum costaricense]KAK1529174.1 hypothetical protein CCOS01_07008 [Colletotrichum costaricense]